MQIVIRIPDSIEERVASFPFLKALRNHFLKVIEESEEEVVEDLALHLVTEETSIDVLYLLPFNAFYHDYPKAELKNIFNIHRTAVNLKVPHVDYYFSLTDSLADATMGLSLKAKHRIGFITPKTKMMFQYGLERMEGATLAEQYMSLLRPIIEEIKPPPIVVSRELEAIVEDHFDHPYFVCNLPLVNNEIPSEWIEFLEFFENIKIYVMCEDLILEHEGADRSEILKEKFKAHSFKSTVIPIDHKNIIEWGKLISYAKFFISEMRPYVHIACFCSGLCYVVGEKPNNSQLSLSNFTGEVRYITPGDSDFAQGSVIDLGKVFDYLHEKYFSQKQDSDDQEADHT
jgi:ADP-heptose:LPS heptosyltransferase